MFGSRNSPGWAGREAHLRRPPGEEDSGVGDQRFQNWAAGRKWQGAWDIRLAIEEEVAK